MPVQIARPLLVGELDLLLDDLVVSNRRLLLVAFFSRAVGLTRAVGLALLHLLEDVRGPPARPGAVRVALIVPELLIEDGRFPRLHVVRVGPENGLAVDHDHPRLCLATGPTRAAAESLLQDVRRDLLQGLGVEGRAAVVRIGGGGHGGSDERRGPFRLCRLVVARSCVGLCVCVRRRLPGGRPRFRLGLAGLALRLDALRLRGGLRVDRAGVSGQSAGREGDSRFV